jgi:hypothetical protein
MVSQAPDFAHGLVFDFFTKLELFLIRGNSNRKKIKVSAQGGKRSRKRRKRPAFALINFCRQRLGI